MIDVKDIDTHLQELEASVPQLRPGCEKQVRWHGAPGVKTKDVILYVHGFSASGAELRPLPDLVADHLGANVYFTRLTGHGQDGAAMARATFADWQRDMVEAIALAGVLGDRLIIMGCSTGCTLATLSLSQGAQAAAVVHMSPNFGMTNRALQLLLDLPGARHWGKYVAGAERSFEPINPAHEKYWTVRYPTVAVSTMADAVRAVRKQDLSNVMVPAFFAVNEDDTVVSPAEARRVAARWAGETTIYDVVPGPGDDVNGHVMAGDIFSPNQTEPLAQEICQWLDRVLDHTSTCAQPSTQAM